MSMYFILILLRNEKIGRSPVTAWATGAPLSAWGLITPPTISRTVGRGESCEAVFDSSPQDAPKARELKVEVTCKVKVRLNVKIRRFDVLDPGDQDYRT